MPPHRDPIGSTNSGWRTVEIRDGLMRLFDSVVLTHRHGVYWPNGYALVPLLVHLPFCQAPGQLPSTTSGQWSVVHSKTIHAFSALSVRSLSNNHHPAIHLFPVSLSIPISPPSVALSRDRLIRVATILMRCCRGRVEVIEELLYWSRWAVVEMWCHTFFFY